MEFLLSVLFFFFIVYLVGKLFFRLLAFFLLRKSPIYKQKHAPENNFEPTEKSTEDEIKLEIKEEDIIEAEFEDIIEDDDKRTERKDG